MSLAKSADDVLAEVIEVVLGNRVRAVDVGDFEADELVVRLGGEVAEVEDFPERQIPPRSMPRVALPRRILSMMPSMV